MAERRQGPAGDRRLYNLLRDLRLRPWRFVVFRAILTIQGPIESACPYDDDRDVSGPCWLSFPNHKSVMERELRASRDLRDFASRITGYQVLRVANESITEYKGRQR